MTLLTKKVADEIAKTGDHIKQVDEVHAHSDNVNPGNLDDANKANVDRGNNIDNANPSRTETEGIQRNQPSLSTETLGTSAIIPAAPSGMSDNLIDVRSTLKDPRAVEAFDNMFGKMRGNSVNMERAIEGIRKKGTDLEESMLAKWERANRTAFGAAAKQIPDALARGQKLRDEVQAFKDTNPQIKGIDEWFRRINGELKNLNQMERGMKEAIPEEIQGYLVLPI